MTREFVLLPEFEKRWKAIGLDDKSLRNLEEQLLFDPQKGSVMQGTGGLRKIRVPISDKGKSGGARVLYVDFVVYEKIYLITAYTKNEKDNLTKEECNNIKKAIEELEKELAKRR